MCANVIAETDQRRCLRYTKRIEQGVTGALLGTDDGQQPPVCWILLGKETANI